MSSSTVTYTSISFDSDLPPWGFHLMDPDEFEASQSPEQAPPSPDYVPDPEYPKYLAFLLTINFIISSSTVTYTSISFDSDLPPWGFHLMDPDEFEAPQSPEQAPPSPDYVPDPEYPKYLAPSDDEIPVEDQPLPFDALPIALSPGYMMWRRKRSEDDDDDEKEEEKEEEHLAPTDSAALLAIDPVPSAEETEPFETDESAATPPPPQTIIPYASAPTPPSPPPSPLSPLSSLLLRIPSPPLLLPPLHTSPTYARALLGYRAAMVQLRVASPPLPVPSPPLLLPSADRRSDIPEDDMPSRKRLCITAPASRFEVGESSKAAAARQTGHTLAHRADYGFIDTLDASIRASEGRVMTIVGEVNERVTYLATTQRQDAHEFYVRHEDAQDDRALLRAQIFLLTRERQYFRFMSLSYEREAIYARQVWSRSEDMSMALEALIRAQKDRITSLEAQTRALQRDVSVLQRQRIDNGDRLTMHIQQEHGRHRELERSRDVERQDGPTDVGSTSMALGSKCRQREPPPPMSDNAIKALVARSMADALAENEANRNSRNGDDSYEPGCG
ncbi:hypothetical protein Tco_1200500 [Tanacetum coccineum]